MELNGSSALHFVPTYYCIIARISDMVVPALTLSYSMVQSVGIHIHLSFAAMSTVN